jgi:RimJ/RimL family protein N-acetyltransferase
MSATPPALAAVASVARTVRLEPFGPADFTRLIGWVSAGAPESLLQWAGPRFTWPLDAAQLESYLEPTRAAPPTRLVWRADDEAGAPFGHVELTAIDREHRSAALSRVLVDPTRRGEGRSRAMVAAALAVAFGDLGLHRVELRVFDFNTPALRCYESLGFGREGVMRDARRVGDTYWSIVCCSLLADERRQRQTTEEGT